MSGTSPALQTYSVAVTQILTRTKTVKVMATTPEAAKMVAVGLAPTYSGSLGDAVQTVLGDWVESKVSTSTVATVGY